MTKPKAAGETDLFICHAREDNEAIVNPLCRALDNYKVTYWLGELDILPADNITDKINEGLNESRYFLAVMSPAFLKKPYPQGELHSALNRQMTRGESRIIPLLAGSDKEVREMIHAFPLLSNVAYISWSGDPQAVTKALLPLLRPDAEIVDRICFISSEYPPRVSGGLGVHVQHLTKALAEHLNVDVILPSSEAVDYLSQDPRVHPYGLQHAPASYDDPISWLRFADSAAQKIIRLARSYPFDILHCHDWVTVLAGLKCRWTLEIPLVFHLHLPNRSPLCASVENLGLIFADLVTVNSDAMLKELRDRSLPIRQTEVIRNGVDSELFKPAEDWPLDDGYILFVGRLVEQKGLEYLLRAMYYVREKFPEVPLKIVGEGPYREWLERLSSNLMLSPQVEFVGWKVGEDLAILYQRARVVVVPSIYEPFGMTALEALACQRPVLASRVGGLSEIVTHRVTGFLAESRDDLDLAQWLMTLLSNADLRHNMGRAGRDAVLKGGYTWPEIGKQFLHLYEQLKSKPIDKSVPKKAQDFRDQIISVASREELVLADENNLLDKLFDWMK